MATEASLDRKGSLGFTGGSGSLARVRKLTEQHGLKLCRLRDCDEDEEQQGIEEAIGSCKLLAISSFPLFGLVLKELGAKNKNWISEIRIV